MARIVRLRSNIGQETFISAGEIEAAQAQMIQVVVDARRGSDLLAAHLDVDGSRIGYAGLSLGQCSATGWPARIPGSGRSC